MLISYARLPVDEPGLLMGRSRPRETVILAGWLAVLSTPCANAADAAGM